MQDDVRNKPERQRQIIGIIDTEILKVIVAYLFVY